MTHWYVEDSSIIGPQILIIGLRPVPSSILNVTDINSHVITLLPVKNEKQMRHSLSIHKISLKMIQSHSLRCILWIFI